MSNYAQIQCVDVKVNIFIISSDDTQDKVPAINVTRIDVNKNKYDENVSFNAVLYCIINLLL